MALRRPGAFCRPGVAAARGLGEPGSAGKARSQLRAPTMGLFDNDDAEWINSALVKQTGTKETATRAGGSRPPGRIGRVASGDTQRAERPRGPKEPIRTTVEGQTAYGIYAGLSCEGYGKGSQVGGTNNQDSYALNSLGAGIDLLGVFDGHGKEGGKCSAFIAEEMARQLQAIGPEVRQAGVDVGKVGATGPLTNAFVNETKIDSLMSGSTAITVLIVEEGPERRLLVANAGDCRVILGSDGWGGKSLCSQLTVDQTPDRPDEQQRIEKLGDAGPPGREAD
ncbi:phosphatase 2C-like domain-containing protein [Baffinella frigidus]|nr:phosphatase 2C-like domain-containing protein [Cryptophyta sp. CCMP2293]